MKSDNYKKKTGKDDNFVNAEEKGVMQVAVPIEVKECFVSFG